MRLFVIDPETGNKIHLQVAAKSRHELALVIGGRVFNVNGKRFFVDDVSAEIGADTAAVSALVGGFIGVLGGAPGVMLDR